MERMNEWGGDDQYQAIENFVDQAADMFFGKLEDGESQKSARADAHDMLKGELGDLGVVHGDTESQEAHNMLEKELIRIMNYFDYGRKTDEGYSPGDENEEGMVSNCCGAPIMDVYDGHGRCSDCKEMASAVSEGESNPYIVVHAKKGKLEIHADTSYEAAKKAAKKWGLKSTAGIDAHLAINELDKIGSLDEGKYGKKKKKKKKYNEDDTDSGYGWDDAAIAAGALGSAYATGKIANRTPKPLTPYQQLKKDQKAARQAQKQLDRQNRKLAKNNMSVAQSNDKIAQLKQKYPNLGNQNIKAVPDTKLQKAAKFGKAAGKFALKKIAWPIALGYAANSAYKGYHSDPNASLAKKVKNAGVQAVDDYTGGAVGYVYDKMFGEATKSLQEQGFTVQDLQEKVDQFILVKENVDTLRKIVADKSVMPVKFEDGTMKVDMTTASIFLQAFDKMREDNQAKVAEMMRTKAGFLRVMDIIYGAMK